MFLCRFTPLQKTVAVASLMLTIYLKDNSQNICIFLQLTLNTGHYREAHQRNCYWWRGETGEERAEDWRPPLVSAKVAPVHPLGSPRHLSHTTIELQASVIKVRQLNYISIYCLFYYSFDTYTYGHFGGKKHF